MGNGNRPTPEFWREAARLALTIFRASPNATRSHSELAYLMPQPTPPNSAQGSISYPAKNCPRVGE